MQNISLTVEPKRDAVTITIKALCTPPVVPASIVIIVEDVGSLFVSTLVWQCETEQLLSSSSQALFLDALESLELWKALDQGLLIIFANWLKLLDCAISLLAAFGCLKFVKCLVHVIQRTKLGRFVACNELFCQELHSFEQVTWLH